ncbi:hypothetical protein CBS147333_668 [Penicillium roqueforti]|nr:hypothetical protein CBS147333_668 [Penicillium roqueforti]KAI3277640.1 hypothetical protein CBS147308_942 [Penicillium roqueforti]
MDQVIDIELHQTTPPVGPTNTVARVFFAANDTRLITTVKGDPSAGKAGFVSVLPFKDSYDVTDEVSLKHKITIEGQKATCWATYSPLRESVFLTDAASNRLVEVRNDGSKILTILDLRNGDHGLTDVRAIGHYVYALSPGNGTKVAAITVVDSFDGRQIQHFELDKLGAGQRSQGLAIFEK